MAATTSDTATRTPFEAFDGMPSASCRRAGSIGDIQADVERVQGKRLVFPI